MKNTDDNAATTAPETAIADVGAWKRKAQQTLDLESDIALTKRQLEAELNAVRAKFEPDLHPKVQKWEKNLRDLDEFALARRADLFGEDSVKGEGKTYTYRVKKCPPSVELMEGFAEKDAIALLRSNRLGGQCITVKESINKAGCKNASPERLETCGIAIVQREKLELKAKKD